LRGRGGDSVLVLVAVHAPGDLDHPVDEAGQMSKVGLHIVATGPRTGLGAFLERVAAQSSDPLLVKCVGDFSPATEAKRILGDRAITVGRKTGQGWEGLDEHPIGGTPPDAVAELHFRQVYEPAIKANPQIDIWEPSNEWSAYPSWQADWYILMARYFEEFGKRMGVFAFSTGNPPLTWHSAIVRCCLELKRRNAGHVLTSHEYGGVGFSDPTLRDTQPYHALRYRTLYERLRADDAVIPLILSETGQDGGATFIGERAFIEDYAWYDAELMRDDYVIGCCAWTLGNWGSANFAPALPALADYIISHPQSGPLPYRSYLPLVERGVSPAESVSPGAVAAALALGGAAWLVNRRVRARRRVRDVG